MVMPARGLMVPPSRLVPVRTTGTVRPSLPATGAMLVSVGAAGFTVNVKALLVPPAVVAVTLLGPVVAPAAIAKVALIRVAVVLVMVTVTSGRGSTVAPSRLVPLIA